MRTILLSISTPIVRLIPETRFFGAKRWLYRMCGIEIAQGVKICSSAVFLGPGRLTIGRDTWIGHQAMIVSGCSVEIGADVDVAPRAFIGTGTHAPGSLGKAAGPGLQKPVTIGDGCWIGAGSMILPGTHLAPVTTVGAGAIVTRNTERRGMTIAGNPAREIQKPNEESE